MILNLIYQQVKKVFVLFLLRKIIVFDFEMNNFLNSKKRKNHSKFIVFVNSYKKKTILLY